ncbi:MULTISPECIES: LPO_1073/Vpar_1526 family protein [Paraburkholderia]|uniref:Uncharacterized protein n=1 Tax=Paraburkholderia madseniana TaxID=2599607 RepID=A0AAP5BKY6_9BURK|nr:MULTISPECIES: LPO_1073/Vpar_1526 family protein [Paraburkholderia]MCX4150082.1 hypothetical protein [Paraburkholderia madseniana]MDN7153017.1 hypothetical protein [Paraburkholderia sp. WS6]MDQ6411899.1 hypothetical protein [Paraburkholderia madseniana]
MFGGQDQKAENGASALQAGGNITVSQTNNYGLSVADVRELVTTFVRDHLPMVRQVAQAEAQANAREFVEHLFAELAAQNKADLLRELERPAAQAVFTEATIGAAKRGAEMDLSLLAKIVVNRLEAPKESVLRFVSEEAAALLPKLNGDHIAFLGFTLLLANLQFTAATDMTRLEALCAHTLPHIRGGMNMAFGHREYLSGLGLISINMMATGDAFNAFMVQKYPFFNMQEVQNGQFPVLAELYTSYKSTLLPAIALTAPGKFIACLLLQRCVPCDPAVFIPDR